MTNKWPLLIPISVLLLFILCAIIAVPPGLNPRPTPTLSTRQSVIELVKYSDTATGYSLYFNLATFDLESQRWDAQPSGTDWLVELSWIYEGERSYAKWLYHPDLNDIVPLDYWGRFFFNNQAGF